MTLKNKINMLRLMLHTIKQSVENTLSILLYVSASPSRVTQVTRGTAKVEAYFSHATDYATTYTFLNHLPVIVIQILHIASKPFYTIF